MSNKIDDVIKDLKKDDKHVTLNNNDFKNFFDVMADSFLIGSSTGYFLYVNDHFCSELGYTKEEMEGKKFYEFIHPDDIEATMHAQSKLYNGNLVLSFENRYIRKDGTYTWISWKAVQVDGKLYSHPSVKGNNDELMSRIAHELKTPLTSIIGFTELLLLNNLDAETKDYVETIAKSGYDMEKMINNLLDMSKINTNNIHLENTSINQKIIDTINSFSPLAGQKGIVIKFYQKDSHHILSVDITKLGHVLKNLLSNAIKYNKDQGTIDIKFLRDNNQVTFSIRDSGIGIKKDQMQNLYIPFNRLGLTSTYEGSGIGLAYSKKIVDLMQAKIECESEHGKFTEFKITFNIEEQQFGTEEVYSNIKKKPKILYIEDNEITIKLVRKITQNYIDCEFLVALNGLDGLKILNENKIDILLLDLGLPDIYGLDVYKTAKNQGLIDNDRLVLIISAEARAKKIDELYKEGIYEFIPKPIKIKQFTEIFGKCLKKMNISV